MMCTRSRSSTLTSPPVSVQTSHWLGKAVATEPRAAAGIATELIPAGVSASIYTQTSDVETEADGILSYDRVLKVEAAAVRRANDALKAAASRWFARLR